MDKATSKSIHRHWMKRIKELGLSKWCCSKSVMFEMYKEQKRIKATQPATVIMAAGAIG